MKTIRTIIISVILTIIVVGGGMYYCQDQLKKQISTLEDKKSSLEQKMAESIVDVSKVDDKSLQIRVNPIFPENSAFSFVTPQNLDWGLVSIGQQDLTAVGPPAQREQKQFVAYNFTSEFKPSSHRFAIVVANSKYKNDFLVTQGGGVYITEDEHYVYLYETWGISPCQYVDKSRCEREKEEVDKDVAEFMKSFKLVR